MENTQRYHKRIIHQNSLNTLAFSTIESSPLRGEAKEGVTIKSSESGRSMVEMLGVLAIIGVLSAGALKGYNEAMFKYKMNKTIETVQLFLQRFSELDQKGLGEGVGIGYIGDGAQDFVKYGLLDECQQEDDYSCRLPLGTIDMDFTDNGSYILGYFDVNFTSVKECIAFGSVHWENAIPTEWFLNDGYIGIGGAGDDPIYYPKQNINKTSLADISKICEEQYDGTVYYSFAIRNW